MARDTAKQEVSSRRRMLGSILLRVVASAICIFGAASANAQSSEITILSVNGIWYDPVDNVAGSQQGEPVITNGDPTSIIRWGRTSGQQSGYDFTAQVPPPFDLPGPVPFFSMGSFVHNNFSVSPPSLVSVQLDVVIVMAVDGVQIPPLTFTYTINHEETPNNLDPCPYPTPPGEGCTDRVTIVASPDPTTFNVDGVDYTLDMSFLNNGEAVDEFITREGNTVNTTGLIGEFTLPPGLSATKTGPSTMYIGEWGQFTVAVQNQSEADAHNTTILDILPDGATGGMCDTTPEILSARVFQADGVTPVPGKGPLVEGPDYSLNYNGATCELAFNTLSAAAVIAVDERLVITYRTQLDTDTQDGAAAHQRGRSDGVGNRRWFDAVPAHADRWHDGHGRPRGRAHRYGGTAGSGVPKVGRERDHGTRPRD